MRTLKKPLPTLWLARYLRHEGIDLVHTHQRRAHLVGRTAALLAGRAVISTIHGHFETESGWRAAVLRKLDYLTARALNARVLLVCEAQRQAYLRHSGLPTERLQTCLNGVDTNVFRPDQAARERLRAALNVSPETLLLVTTANRRAGKGLEILLEAAAHLRARVPEARLFIAGDRTDDAELQAHAAALGLGETSRLLGQRSDVPALLAAADIYVHPSIFDVLPTSVLEAMATERPVVATQVGGVPEMVRHGRTGLLVPPGSPADLADAIAQLREPTLRAAMGAEGRAWVQTQANRELWLDHHQQLYRQVTARHR
jgi:glycosyltransferase involved in cell wall biosynthesis